MAENDFTCRFCGRPIAVAMSTCPWPDCRETIMVICAACRAYTDDQGEFCEQCGEPLVAATFEEIELSVGTQALLVQLAHDQARARLVASGVIARYSSCFLGSDAPEDGVLAKIFGVPLTSKRRATAVLFAAVAYLVQDRYCDLERDAAVGPEYVWTEARDWDGQKDSLEAKLAAEAWQMAPLGEALRHMIARETGLLLEEPEPDSSLASDEPDPSLDDGPFRVPKALNRLLDRLPRRQDHARAIPPRPAIPAILERSWDTVLPEHEEAAACEETRQLLADFETADPLRAQHVLDRIREVLDWFERAQQDPQVEPPGRDAVLADIVEAESVSSYDEAQEHAEGEDYSPGGEDGSATAEEDHDYIRDSDVAAEDEDADGQGGSTYDEDNGTSSEGVAPSSPGLSEEESPDEDDREV